MSELTKELPDAIGCWCREGAFTIVTMTASGLSAVYGSGLRLEVKRLPRGNWQRLDPAALAALAAARAEVERLKDEMAHIMESEGMNMHPAYIESYRGMKARAEVAERDKAAMVEALGKVRANLLLVKGVMLNVPPVIESVEIIDATLAAAQPQE